MEYALNVYIISTTLIKLLAGVLFLIGYLKTRRFSALLISFAWFLAIPVATFIFLLKASPFRVGMWEF